jgi:hypothetical protein
LPTSLNLNLVNEPDYLTIKKTNCLGTQNKTHTPH